VSLESVVADVLLRLSDAQVETLVATCRGRKHPSNKLAQLAQGGTPGAQDALAELIAAWEASTSLSGDGLALALHVGLKARQDAARRRARPVWTGPGAAGEQRLTAAVLHELVAHADERVLLVSYAAFTLSELASDLEAAVARGCEVDVLFETEDDSAGAYSGAKSTPFGAVAGIKRWHWPNAHRPPGALLHAKLLVVDGRRALVGSANLTHRALSANLEAGVLIEDAELAASFEAHVRSLMSDGTLAAG
jgi:cardiolipin synthase A/B